MRERDRSNKKRDTDRVEDRQGLSGAMSGEPAPIDVRAFAARAGRVIANAARKANKRFRRYRPSRRIAKGDDLP
jgi:hypothetical protein